MFVIFNCFYLKFAEYYHAGGMLSWRALVGQLFFLLVVSFANNI